MADGAETSSSGSKLRESPSGDPFVFKCGWFGDGGLGEKLISAILSGRKSATACPVYDPEDAALKTGDKLRLTDKHGRSRGLLRVTAVEVRLLSAFDEALALRAGSASMAELREKLAFANGRELRPDEEMRIVHFEVIT